MKALVADVVLETRSVHSLGPSELERCRRLTHGPEGSMYQQLEASRQEAQRRSKVILARYRPTRNIVGWALIFKYEQTDSPWYAYFYVDRLGRNQGIGSALAQEVLRRTRGDIYVWTGRFKHHRYKH